MTKFEQLKIQEKFESMEKEINYLKTLMRMHENWELMWAEEIRNMHNEMEKEINYLKTLTKIRKNWEQMWAEEIRNMHKKMELMLDEEIRNMHNENDKKFKDIEKIISVLDEETMKIKGGKTSEGREYKLYVKAGTWTTGISYVYDLDKFYNGELLPVGLYESTNGNVNRFNDNGSVSADKLLPDYEFNSYAFLMAMKRDIK